MFGIQERFVPVVIGAGVAAAALTIEKLVERMFATEWEYDDEPEGDELEEESPAEEAATVKEVKETKEVRLANVS